MGEKFWVVHTDVATADGAAGLKNEQTIEGSNPAKGIDSETVKTDTDEKKVSLLSLRLSDHIHNASFSS